MSQKSALFSSVILGLAVSFAWVATNTIAQAQRAPEQEPQVRPRSAPPSGSPGATPPRRSDVPGADAQGRSGQRNELTRPPGKDKQAAKKKPAPPGTPEARDKALSNLYAQLATSADPGEAGPIAAAIEMLWVQSGSDTVSLLLARATQAVVERKTELAEQLLDAVVELAPDFAEGLARRAYFHYSENDFGRAVADLKRALALEPNHYRALDGLVAILREGGQKAPALKVLKQLEQVHPHWPGIEDKLRELEREVEGQGI